MDARHSNVCANRFCQQRTRASRSALGLTTLGLAALGFTACSANYPYFPREVEPTQNADLAHNLLQQSGFDDGVMLPWMASFSPPATGAAEVKDRAVCVNVENGGKDRWDAQLRHREMTLQQDHTYSLSFRAWASRETAAAVKVGMAGSPYTDHLRTMVVQLSPTAQNFTRTFRMKSHDDPTTELAFHFGGPMLRGSGPLEICFDDVVLSDPAFQPRPRPAKPAAPDVRVNQLAYGAHWPKVASVLSDTTEPLPWQLLTATGEVIAQGSSQVFGKDEDSASHLHWVDFSAVASSGKDFILRVNELSSDPFEIRSEPYAELSRDAFKYFYHNRSGIAIEARFAADARWARPAGHPKDVAPCAAIAGCDYTLDVTGGWYDAGDHGKYVVNGGLSVWILLNAYERATRRGNTAAQSDQFGLPESGNGRPDLLDEARWELEFLLRMQVPEGKPFAGMAHHKVHDEAWTMLGTAPHEDKERRFLRPVSTAATLNLAAVAAQAARLYAPFDPVFSQRCLAAAERAYTAAHQNPKKLATASDSVGGGPYDDDDLSDEFYWAAAELYASSGKDRYYSELKQSALDGALPTQVRDMDGARSSFTWYRTEALGKASLILMPKLATATRREYEQQFVAAANAFEELSRGQGFGLPFKGGKGGAYPWGSNSFVINNALVLALAHDVSGDAKYLNAVVFSMDYLLGRNALGQSYVSGYGERPLLHPHHRFWAQQANPAYPPTPPGALSGGPNSGLQDPYVKAAGLVGCAPQRCFIDHIEAWSVNEITINWNAPLFWVTLWLNEQAK